MELDEAQRFADQLKDVLESCLAHVRLLDVNREGTDREASTDRRKAYNVSLWVGDREMRKQYREKMIVKTAATTVANAASNRLLASGQPTARSQGRGWGDSRSSWDGGSSTKQQW